MSTYRFILVALFSLFLAVMLAACGGGGGSSTGSDISVNLSALTITTGDLDQVFQAGQHSYTATVPFAVESMKIVPTAEDSEARISVNGQVVASGRQSGAFALTVGGNTFKIVVTAAGGSKQTNTLEITRSIKVGPVVVETTPRNHAMGAVPSADITATFSDDIDHASVTTSSFTVARRDGTPVSGTVSVHDKQVRFNPDTALAYATDYVVTLTTDITDIYGAPLEMEYQWRFNTGNKLVAGNNHTCARLDSGPVKCWGDNSYGQLGLGNIETRGDEAGEMGTVLSTVELGIGRTAVALAAGDNYTCALLDNGAVKCWGDNTYGQLGLGDFERRGDQLYEMGDALPAVDLGSGRTALAITAGFNHTCALLDNGSVKCWGENDMYGLLGLGDTERRGDQPGEMGDALPAVDLGSGRTAIAVTAGGYHTCALLDDDTIKCWGNNYSGELGVEDSDDRGWGAGQMGDALPAVDLGSGHIPVAVTAGGYHTCALLDDNSIKCWGANDFGGLLGLGESGNRGDEPGEMGNALPTVDLGSGRTVVEVAANVLHTCARLDDASVKCWGYNGYGQLGLGDFDVRGDGPGEMGDALPAVDLGSGRTAAAVAVGYAHSCALLDDDTIKCWGYNGYGQLGLGDISDRGWYPGQMGDALPVVDLGAT
jgi:alpha-tubulin suppressor-like RCC1 family protein